LCRKFNNKSEILVSMNEISLSRNTVMCRTEVMIENSEKILKKKLINTGYYTYNLMNDRMSLIHDSFVYLFECGMSLQRCKFRALL